MPVKEKPIGYDPKRGVGPVSPGKQNEFCKLGVDGRFASDQRELFWVYSFIPELHPMIGFIERKSTLVALVGIVRTAFAREITTVNEMDFQITEVLQGIALPQTRPRLFEYCPQAV